MGEAGGKLGEASYFWGKHAFYVLKNVRKMGEAIDSTTLFIILKRWGKGGKARAVRGRGVSSRILPAVGRFFGSGGHHELECMFQRARGDTMNSSVGSGGGPRIMSLGSKTGVQKFRVGFGPV